MSHGANDSWWAKLARPVLEFPLDLAFLGIAVALAAFPLYQSEIHGTPLALALGLPVALFAPGYAVVSLLFPGNGPSRCSARSLPNRLRRGGITVGERLALSFGVSLSLLPLFGLALTLAGFSFTLFTVLFGLVSLTLGATLLAVIRRLTIPADDRFSISIRGGASRLNSALFDAETGADVALNLVLALSVVVALSAVGYAFVAPQDGEQFSQLSLLTQTDDGEFVAENYPESFTPGETQPVYVSVTNHEEAQTKYTVVAELQRVEQRPDGSARIVEEEGLERFDQRVRAGESWRTQHDIAPTMAGENLRVVYLLYKGDPPTDPTIENADEHAYIWITVGMNETETTTEAE
ncbi:Uncharacterized membrane protein [Haladaptatus litoreus]|uniref:Uncharacterized membrane protein n=1 Tax=Haladaptatus litoreus TaxID=553468 RepID=A0A1N6YYR4_9EURY|nr:DUF1616 domain-containing protein [Haladaptatus litoreus]SIR19763.1 Uncharacterized membrane protein [Haladaptatus litoreus]